MTGGVEVRGTVYHPIFMLQHFNFPFIARSADLLDDLSVVCDITS